MFGSFSVNFISHLERSAFNNRPIAPSKDPDAGSPSTPWCLPTCSTQRGKCCTYSFLYHTFGLFRNEPECTTSQKRSHQNITSVAVWTFWCKWKCGCPRKIPVLTKISWSNMPHSFQKHSRNVWQIWLHLGSNWSCIVTHHANLGSYLLRGFWHAALPWQNASQVIPN